MGLEATKRALLQGTKINRGKGPFRVWQRALLGLFGDLFGAHVLSAVGPKRSETLKPLHSNAPLTIFSGISNISRSYTEATMRATVSKYDRSARSNLAPISSASYAATNISRPGRIPIRRKGSYDACYTAMNISSFNRSGSLACARETMRYSVRCIG